MMSTEAKTLADIERLSRENEGAGGAPISAAGILRLRHRAGAAIRAREARGSAARPFPAPAVGRLPERATARNSRNSVPPTLHSDPLRAAILRDGCMLVRGLIHRGRALRLAEGIDRSFDERGRGKATGNGSGVAYYEEFALDKPDPGLIAMVRPWIRSGRRCARGRLPRACAFEMFEAFEGAGLREAIGGYLGEGPRCRSRRRPSARLTPDVAWKLASGRVLPRRLSVS